MMLMRRGFSFAEVLFAVAVLGIGFIMVAAIFPAAILQTQAAIDETVGTTVARNGGAQIALNNRMNRTGPTALPETE
jgi:Tfp pilus assembly protein PilV